MKFRLIALLAVLSAAPAFAETVKDREGAVRKERELRSADARWKFNDLDSGFAEAKKTGKPILVTVRCIPCMSCMGLDAAVLASQELQPLLDQFVCVRIINANTLDLSLFQFDYDLSFSTLIFNADRTIYGRYGSWSHQKDPTEASTAGYKAALEAALVVHKGYPANKESLAGKQGGPSPFKVPVEIPSLAAKYSRDLNWEGKVVQSCVHCHQIGDASRGYYREQKKPIPLDLMFPMPAPDNIGAKMDAAKAATVAEVIAGTPAAAAGLMTGDEIISANGQPLVSVADFAWVLHRMPDSGGEIKLKVSRNGAQKELTAKIQDGWRMKVDISTRVGTWSMRGVGTGGLVLTDLADDERKKRGLDTEKMALFVKGAGQYGIHGAAKNAGFLKDDVLVEVDGISRRMSEGELLGHLLTAHPGKDRVKATILRNGERKEMFIPMQ